MKFLRSLSCRFLIFFIGISQNYLFAQTPVSTQTIRGKVLDADSKFPLFGVTVIVSGTSPLIGATTDEDGKFKLQSVPIGRQTVIVKYLGYEDFVASNLLITAAKEEVLEITLTESITTLGEVVITADNSSETQTQNDMALVSARGFSVEESKRYAGSFNDPARMASSFAGVTGDPSGNNDIIIRGNSPRGLLWRLEGVEIPNPNHFGNAGASGGAISMLNSNMLANSDFFTGAFPAEYGNALSGVFDIHLKKGNNEKNEHALGVSLLGVDVASQGPFSKSYNGSYAFNYRYSTLDLMNKLGVKPVGDNVPRFQDIGYNFIFPTKKAGTFSLFGVGGISGIASDAVFNEEIPINYHEDFNTGMIASGVKHTIFTSKQAYLQSIILYSGNSIKYKGEIDSLGRISPVGTQDYNESNARVSVLYNHKLSASHTFRVGVIGSRKFFNLENKYAPRRYAPLETDLKDNGEADIYQGYISWKYRPTEKLTIQPGLHYLAFAWNGAQSLEPRLASVYQLSTKNSLNFGAGIHSKSDNIALYQAKREDESGIEYQPNLKLQPSKALHFVAGYQQKLSNYLNLKMDVYYQHLYNVPVENDSSSYLSILNYSENYTNLPLVNKGTGKNYGIEITVERFFGKGYYFLITNSFYKSRFTALDGIERNSRYDGNYVSNILGGKEIALKAKNKKRALTISGKILAAGGQRYTPIMLEESIAKGEQVVDKARPFGEKAGGYYRMDFQLTLRTDKKKNTREWKLDIQNITNRLNPVQYYYNNDTKKIEYSTLLGLFPVLSYKVEF